MGLASFTVNGRPSSCEPLRVAMALSAPSSSMTTNPNPFERPESRSVMILTDSTVPYCVNVSVMALSVVWNDKKRHQRDVHTVRNCRIRQYHYRSEEHTS